MKFLCGVRSKMLPTPVAFDVVLPQLRAKFLCGVGNKMFLTPGKAFGFPKCFHLGLDKFLQISTNFYKFKQMFKRQKPSPLVKAPVLLKGHRQSYDELKTLIKNEIALVRDRPAPRPAVQNGRKRA